jgi:hypothetical protein
MTKAGVAIVEGGLCGGVDGGGRRREWWWTGALGGF